MNSDRFVFGAMTALAGVTALAFLNVGSVEYVFLAGMASTLGIILATLTIDSKGITRG